MRHLQSLEDFTPAELQKILDRAVQLKAEVRQGVVHKQLAGRTVALIFEKASTRTRVSFESAMYSLGGQVIFLASRDSQLSRSEPLKDTARVLSRYVDGIVIRTFGQEIVEELAAYSTVPVINALTDLYHPCQIMSDLLTVLEIKGTLDTKVCWIGDGNNMANAWIQAASLFDFELALACPEGYEPDKAVMERALARARKPITLVRDPAEVIRGADVVNTDVWASMGQEEEQRARMAIFKGYQVDSALMATAAEDAIFMHCLPAHRGEEVTEEVLESEQSVIFDQAENKMHMHRALLDLLLTDSL